jgi:hypothetical protein
MADYQENTIPGTITSWRRCNAIAIQNPYSNDPTSINVQFNEEVIKVLPDGEVIKSTPDKGNITKEFDPSIVIAMRNPETWELTGESVPMGEIMAMIGSAYWQFALERDAAL